MSKSANNLLKKERILWNQIIFNKYTISILAFVVWISFIDGHNLISQYKLKNTIEALKQERSSYIKQIASAKIERQDIVTNKEKYAREKYFMHRENENVFIILNNKNKK